MTRLQVSRQAHCASLTSLVSALLDVPSSYDCSVSLQELLPGCLHAGFCVAAALVKAYEMVAGKLGVNIQQLLY